MALASNQAFKNAETHKKAYMAALRARQADEELMGFTQDFQDGNYNDGDHTLDPESEDNSDSDASAKLALILGSEKQPKSNFSTVTIPPTKKAIAGPANADSDAAAAMLKNIASSEIIKPSPIPRKTLVRRSISGAQLPFSLPVLMNQFRLHVDGDDSVGSPSPTVPKVYYGYRPDVSDEETSPVVTTGNSRPSYMDQMRPVGASSSKYPNAHPELESFPQPTQPRGPANAIRKSPPPTPSPSSTIIIKKTKTDASGGSRGHVRAGDFDDISKALLEDAYIYYRGYICTINPYPDRIQDCDWAAKVWVKACEDRNLRMEFDEDILKLITQRASQVRGQLKTVCRPLVESMYQLNIENGKRNNCDKVEDLLDRASFLYKDPKERTGLYLHPIIQTAINKMWFKHKQDDGAICHEFSVDGIPIITIALVATAIKCCLDEQQTGERTDVPFSALVYQEKFNTHLATISNFEKKTHDENIIPRLCNYLLKNARKHAKITEILAVRGTGSHLDVADVEAAKKEWEVLNLSDDE